MTTNYLLMCGVASALLMTACSGKKTTQTQTDSVTKVTLLDSIDKAIMGYEQRLDIKMKRKKYDAKPGTLVTIQKWFEYGDTTRLVKLRAETLTGDTKMEIEQYHFIDNELAQIHNYTYNKTCDDAQKQCMDESKYYFDKDTLKLAQKRHAEGTAEHPPVIEQIGFALFKSDKAMVSFQKDRLARINTKYASLPLAKQRPEQGTPVPVKR